MQLLRWVLIELPWVDGCWNTILSIALFWMMAFNIGRFIVMLTWYYWMRPMELDWMRCFQLGGYGNRCLAWIERARLSLLEPRFVRMLTPFGVDYERLLVRPRLLWRLCSDLRLLQRSFPETNNR
jgi:hypothetical protein